MSEFQEPSRRLKGSALQSSYAMAENVFAVSQSNLDRPEGPLASGPMVPNFAPLIESFPLRSRRPGAIAFTSSGHVLPGHEIRIISEAGMILGDNSVGEILVKSDCLFDGYFNRPDLTSQALIDGW